MINYSNLIILGPCNVAELDILQSFWIVLSSLHVAELDDLPVTSGGREAVGEDEAVVTPGTVTEADGSVLGQSVGVKQHTRLGLQSVLDIDHALILETAVAREEVLVAFFVWTTDLFIIPKVCQIFLDLILIN